MTRGRDGWLGLSRVTLAFTTPRRSPGALSGLRALDTSACERMSMWPQQLGGIVVRTEVLRTTRVRSRLAASRGCQNLQFVRRTSHLPTNIDDQWQRIHA